jgi:hypothetical protein
MREVQKFVSEVIQKFRRGYMANDQSISQKFTPPMKPMKPEKLKV